MSVSVLCMENGEVEPIMDLYVHSELPEKHKEEIDTEENQPFLVY